MKAMLGISLYSYLFLKLAKMMYLLLSLMFSLQHTWRRGQNRFCMKTRGWGGKGGGEGQEERWPKQCMHIGINE
jgi:hypothetical protein